MSQPETSQPLGTTSARLVAVRLKSANKNIFRALLSLASVNLLVRIVGMVNQSAVAFTFGQGAVMDAYYAAQTLPFTVTQLLGGALEASVIPVFTKVSTRGMTDRVSRLFSTILNLLIIGLVGFTILMLILHQSLVILFAPGLPHDTLELAITLAPYTFPIVLMITLNSFMEYLLNARGQFGWPAYLGLLAPLITIVSILVWGKFYGVIVLCLSTLAGQILQLIAILIRAHMAKFVYVPVLDLRDPALLQIGKTMTPAIFAAFIGHISPLVDQIFTSSLVVGSLAALNTANKLYSVPVGVILSSTGRAALPVLSSQVAIRDMKAFKNTLRLYLWAVGSGTIVLTLGMIILGHPVIALLFQHGDSFKAADTTRTAITLIGYSIGLTPLAFGFILSRAFSALGKTHIFIYNGIVSVIANVIFDYLFVGPWQTFGIALSTSAVNFCTMAMLLIILPREVGSLNLLTPPREFLGILRKLGLDLIYVQWKAWREDILTLFPIPYSLYQRLSRVAIALAVFAAGIAGTINNAMFTLRIAFGSLVILALMRYPYILLLIWVAVDALIGSVIPFFNGNNFLSGLVAPTLLLMFAMPIKQAFKLMPTLPFLFAYVMWTLLGIGVSPDTTTQFLTIWTVYLAYVAVGVLVVNLVTTRKLLMGLIDAILVQSIFLSFFGIYGYFTKQYGLYDTDISSLYRIGSVYGAPPTLAFFLSMVIPLAFYRTFTLRGLQRALGVVVTLILLAALGLTFTRGAIISVSLSLVVMIFFLPSRRLKISLLGGILALGALAILVATFLDLPLFSRFLNSDILTLNGRTYLWKALLDNFDPGQWLGYGLEASDAVLTRLNVGHGGGVIGTAPHNVFIGSLFDFGIIGVSLMTLMFISIPWTLISRMRKATIEHRLILAVGLAAFINIFVQSLEVTVVWSQPVGIYVWMILALPFALYWSKPEQTPPQAYLEETQKLVVPRITHITKQEQPSHV
ncbi:hypothetical protein EPA93_21260 [Ktedonosporobacter rubrisoli]|uniref:O-antigen ligase-related domain-containing protein n=1 Tax=Ktedonosporobacter rubrisoli TaxID=2509675 RepID=A0A4P6JSY6_KTERU|nr:lipid II flippase MurJ [Ktedonosporobacter rubrisoli]QBD78390.1 hypothetical protein EPA93_21260 [Ktedonosporobacter rubrisoli]